MRDRARILPILMRIAHAWMRQPDLRLGQLLTNAMASGNLFYVEDEDLAEKVEEYTLRTVPQRGWNNTQHMP